MAIGTASSVRMRWNQYYNEDVTSAVARLIYIMKVFDYLGPSVLLLLQLMTVVQSGCQKRVSTDSFSVIS
jgi:hypothetical protein